MTRWFSSDHHLWHYNIIKFCDRPFRDTEHMLEELIERHNAVVQPSDHATFLGDVTLLRGGQKERGMFIKTMRRFNGHKRLFLGNHDHWPVKVYLDAGFEKIYATWRDDSRLLYSHIPVHPMSMGSAIANIHGHIHNSQASFPSLKTLDKHGNVVIKPYINVCLEVCDYRPISHEEIMVKVREAQNG